MPRGGKRPGAGRKTDSPRVAVSMRVSAETKAVLDRLKAEGLTTGVFIDRLVSSWKASDV